MPIDALRFVQEYTLPQQKLEINPFNIHTIHTTLSI